MSLPMLRSMAPSSMTYTYAKPTRVRKVRTFAGETPWVVTNHPAGPMLFTTWDAAMDYADIRARMMREVA